MRAATILLVLLAAACGPRADPAVEEGQRLAQARCASCHALGPTGASPRPPAPPFRDLHRRYPVDQLAEALAEGIVTGRPEMPEYRFERAEVDAFIAYLRSLER